MSEVSNKTALVWDTGGLFIHVADTLARDFQKVLYYSPWSGGGFPSQKRRAVGMIDSVERVYSWLTRIPEIDVAIFPDIFTFDEVVYLRSLGIPVWGSGAAEALEIQRYQTHQLMAELGMPTIPTDLVIGTDALREYVKEHEDVWVKCNGTNRGDFETRHALNAKLVDGWITDVEMKLDSFRHSFEFIVEQSVPGVEIGFDGYYLNGMFPPVAMWGIEVKDRGYVGRVCEYDDMPDAIKQVNEAFSPAMSQLGMQGFYSAEIRVAEDGTPYLIDPCTRAGRPPSECYMEAFDNWADVIFAGAQGHMRRLEPRAKYAVEVILKSDWVREHFLSVEYPAEIAQFVKIGNSFDAEGTRHVIPQDDPEFGSAIGLGETLDEACEMALANAEKVEAVDIDYKTDVCDVAKKELEKAAAHGITF